MFAAATKNFVEEVDVGGSLMPVSSLNYNISVLTLVVKRTHFWFWQKDKYTPTDFKLNDILTGGPFIKPVTEENDFIKYTGTRDDNIQGSVDAKVSPLHVSVTVEGKDSSKLQTSFGGLKKEEVDMQELLQDCKDRVLDMSHSLILQTKDKSRRSFGIVKERIVTTQLCSVIEELQRGIGLSLCGVVTPKVSLKDNASLTKGSNVTMEIPIGTTIAFAIDELEVKQDGHFELCLMSDTKGGFDVDGTCQILLGDFRGAPANNNLKQELRELEKHFQVLSALPTGTRSSLLQQLTEVLQEPGALDDLQCMLDYVCTDDWTSLKVAAPESQTQCVHTILALLERSAQGDQRTPVLVALNLIISALDEMTDDGLALLKQCCSSAGLHTLELLVREVAGEGGTPPSCDDEDLYQKAEHLFAFSNMSLKRGETLKVEIKQQSGHLPLVLCITIRGLASLAHCD